MTDHSSEPGHGEDVHAGIHLPDPSVWPFVGGFAALLLGAALVWWSRDSNSQLAGPLLGAAALSALIAGCGWAYEDSRMRRKAEGQQAAAREARFTQVVTFAIAEGKLDAARAEDGVLDHLNRTDSSLRDLAGFQDLRIIAAPAATGPSQILVETTWSDREGLATYEETRRTILDLIAAHDEEVVSGTVQVFDMEVVRDTKDMAFKFGLGPAAAVIGSLVIGGFMVGAGLTTFQEEGTASAGGEAEAPNSYQIIGQAALTFNKNTLEAPPNTPVTYTLTTRGGSHNLRFLTAAGGQPIAKTEIISTGSTEVSFTSPAAGNYYFDCEVHPTTMSGQFIVRDGAPPPPGAAPAGSPAATGSPAASPTP